MLLLTVSQLSGSVLPPWNADFLLCFHSMVEDGAKFYLVGVELDLLTSCPSLMAVL